MLTWKIKRAWIPVRYDTPFCRLSWLQLYWEGSITTNTTKIVKRYPAWKHEKSHYNPNIHNKVFIDDPDQYYIGPRIPDPVLFSLNRKEW
jgi:hypothetical protein